jgi:hypothetical protein
LATRKFDIRDLGRLALWGLMAAAALTAVTYASSTDVGRQRVRVAVAEIHEILMPTGVPTQRPLTAQEGRRLAETVSTLAADRERLLARIATLEHSVEDITGSIARVQKAAEAAQRPPEPAPLPQPEAATPATKPPDDVTSSITVPAQTLPQPQPAPSVAKPEFGLDLGSATTVEALRLAWTAALRRHGKLLEGLNPIVHRRERPRSAAVELRLVAGPLPNAATAARICAAMTAVGAICQPTMFEGQRLALH